jgi:hypothetical protein
MPPPKKALSPASRAKADKRNARVRAKRASDVAESGGAKSGKRKATTEEEMPASGGGSSLPAPSWLDGWAETTKEICFDLLLNIINHRESELEFRKTAAELAEGHVKLLEGFNTEKYWRRKTKCWRRKTKCWRRKTKCWKRNIKMC